MKIRALRKAAILLLADIVIIIGIFVLQFRTDSSILEKLGNLQLTFTKADSQENLEEVLLQNSFRLSYNGLNIFFDDKNPAMVTKDSIQIPLTLISYEKTELMSFILNFSEDVRLNIALSSEDSDADLTMQCLLPLGLSNFTLPYSYSTNMKVQKEEKNQIVLEGKKNIWEFDANSLENNLAVIENSTSLVKYAIYTETAKFSLDMLAVLPTADPLLFASNVQKFKSNIISAFNPSSQEASSELVVLAYISAMSERQNYAKAIEDIPQSFRRSKQRTYLSAPYLDTLEEMNVTLDSTLADYEKKLTSSSISSSLDVFMIRNIADFMYIHSNPQTIIRLLDFAASLDVSNLSLAQVTGILEVYVDLLALEPSYARHLESVLDECIQKITDCCSYDGAVLTISENDTFLSVIQGIETGMALLRYALASGNSFLEKAGYVIVNSYLSDSSFDIRTASNLYPVVAYDSPYYPHLEKIGTVAGEKLWAWTCAKSIKQTSSASELTLTIDFPLECTHYVIIKGIPKFEKIFIYDMQFRTDLRFETYNSSGYVYKSASKTLLLKSRHKKQLENIRFVLDSSVNSASNSSVNSSSSVTATSNEKLSNGNSTFNSNSTGNNSSIPAIPSSSTSTNANGNNASSSNITSSPSSSNASASSKSPPQSDFEENSSAKNKNEEDNSSKSSSTITLPSNISSFVPESARSSYSFTSSNTENEDSQ